MSNTDCNRSHMLSNVLTIYVACSFDDLRKFIPFTYVMSLSAGARSIIPNVVLLRCLSSDNRNFVDWPFLSHTDTEHAEFDVKPRALDVRGRYLWLVWLV